MSELLVISIPNHFDGQSMTTVTRQLVGGATGKSLPGGVCFDLSALGFIQPAGVVFLSNLIHWLREEKRCEVSFRGINKMYSAIRYLDDSQFFIAHLGERLHQDATPRSTTIPYTQVTQSHSHDWLDGIFVPWLSANLDQTAATLAPLRACVSELLNNIADHTRFDIGGISAQHFPNLSRVEIAVADFGIGIPGSVRRVRPGIGDADAIQLACQQGFTTQSTPRNRGAGLDYLLTVVRSNSGTLSIFSGNATVCYTNGDDGNISASVAQSVGFCPGTLIQIDVRTDRLVPAPDEEENFEW